MAKKSMINKQQRTQKYSTREYNRCKICGRPHAYLRKYGICRICFRERAYKGEIPGVRTRNIVTYEEDSATGKKKRISKRVCSKCGKEI